MTASVKVGFRPVNPDRLGGEVWVPADEDDRLTRIDGATGELIEVVPTGKAPAVATAIDGEIRVTNLGGGSVWRIRPGAR